jgi:predicted porin
MRKLLLSALGGCVFAAGGANLACAQTAPPGTTYTVVPRAGIPAPPAPGTIAVSVGGLFQWLVGGVSQSGQNYLGQKLANDADQGFARIFLGMDGQASNGVLYGTQFQIRQDFGNPSGGATPGTGTGGSTLYVYQGYAYVGTPLLGKLQVGAGNGPATVYDLGEFDGFNEGGWNGDAPAFVQGTAQPQYPWLDGGFLQTTDKIAYFSPAFAGFDFGVAWEPAYVTLNDSTSCSTGAAGHLSTCDDLSSSNVFADAGKRRNTFDVGARYRGAFGPLGLAISGGYIGSGVVNYTGIGQRYHGLSVGYLGSQMTVAKVTFGGQVEYGDQNNGDFSLEPVGGKTSTAYIAGGQYEDGPLIAGASYFNTQSTGDYAAPATEGQRAEYGIAAGGYYALTPGLGVFLSYLYGERKQGGYDFLAGAPGPLDNTVHAQVYGIGLSLQW